MTPFQDWLAEIDPPTSAWVARDQTLSPDAEEAFRRGRFYGEWLTLFEMARLLEQGMTDAETLTHAVAGGLLALKQRRSPLDFKLALERAKQITNEHTGGDHGTV